MPQKLTREYVKKAIFEAFKDVPKGNGRGARECIADDDYASEEDQKKAAALDVEQHWWEYPKDLVERGDLDYSLTYNNYDGVKFHIPALMTAAIDGYGNTARISVFSTLCEPYTTIHQYHREYVAYIKSVDIARIIKQYNFNAEQVHAIALYLLLDMHVNNFHTQFFSSHEEIIEQAQKDVERPHNVKDYTVTLKDVVAIVDEKHRIVRDWLKVGEVAIDDYVYEANPEDTFVVKWNNKKALENKLLLNNKLDLSVEELGIFILSLKLTIRDVMQVASDFDTIDQQIKIYRSLLTLPMPPKISGINLERASYLQVPNNLSVLLFNKGDYKGALEVIEPFLQYTSESPYIGHSAACALVKAGRIDEAIEQVRLAVENGYDHVETMRTDKDLEPLFHDKRFKEIFSKYDEEYPVLKDITRKGLEEKEQL